MARRLALVALTLASALILVFSLVGGRTAGLGFGFVAFAFPVLLMALGAADRKGALGPIVWPIGALLFVLEGCLVGMVVWSGDLTEGAWILGLPVATAIQLYGVFLVPLVLVAIGYALTFDRFGVGDDELRRLRELSRRQDDE